jgi:hypothetical protein
MLTISPRSTLMFEGRAYPTDNHMSTTPLSSLYMPLNSKQHVSFSTKIHLLTLTWNIVCILSAVFQRDETIWENPTEFNPDRYSAPQPGSTEAGATEAWQPFGSGPQRCIGQQLAFIEAKVISVLTLRWFDFQSAIKPEVPSILGWGGQAYPEFKLTGKPKDGIPMTVKSRGQ